MTAGLEHGGVGGPTVPPDGTAGSSAGIAATGGSATNLSTHGEREVARAVQNASRLFSSLVITISVAFAVRFWLPRHLGPDVFGILHFSQEFTTATFTLATLGANTYIAKHVALRPAHASEFFGGLFVLRTLLVAVMAVPIALALKAMGKSGDQMDLIGLFCAGQFFFVLNGNFDALLNASGTVRELVRTNVVSKIVWGLAIVAGVTLGAGLWSVALAFLFTELGKSAVLAWACRRHLDLRFTVDLKAGVHVIAASLPFFINYVAHYIAGHIDATMISAMIGDREVGYYGAAINVTFMIFLVLPVFNAVLLPMSARIARESQDELNRIMTGAVRMIILITVPMSVILALGARDAVGLIFSARFMPSVGALQVLSPLVPVTYLCVLFSTQLVQMGRGWTVARVSLIGLCLNPLLNWLLLEPGFRYFGEGGAGLTAACTTVASEVTIGVLLYLGLARQGAHLIGQKTIASVARVAVLALALVLIHPFLAGLAWSRPVVETVLYVAGAHVLGVLPIAEIRAALRKRVA